tara:strand:- start:14514 stop:14777 length:264 start_codon:yes stop_codon:yes gene_type:complete
MFQKVSFEYKTKTTLNLPIMKKFLTLAVIASGLFIVSCTAETESIEPIQNLKVSQNIDDSSFAREGDSIGDTTGTSEGEPYIKKDKD